MHNIPAEDLIDCLRATPAFYQNLAMRLGVSPVEAYGFIDGLHDVPLKETESSTYKQFYEAGQDARKKLFEVWPIDF